nr:hypothetical protein [Tanacetum cinerariifolium]
MISLNEVSNCCGLKLLNIVMKDQEFVFSCQRTMIITVISSTHDTNFLNCFDGCSESDKAFMSFKDFSKRFIRISNLSSREAAICWRSKESEGEDDGRGAFVLTLESVTRLREYRTLDLLSIIDKHSQGILSKKFPPAAESKAS